MSEFAGWTYWRLSFWIARGRWTPATKYVGRVRLGCVPAEIGGPLKPYLGRRWLVTGRDVWRRGVFAVTRRNALPLAVAASFLKIWLVP